MRALKLLVLLLALGWGVTFDLRLGYSSPGGGTANSTLRLLVLLPLKLPFGGEMSGSAVLSALQAVDAAGLLPGYRLEAHFADTSCSSVTGIGMAHEMLGNGAFSAVIGPACSQVCRTVGRLASYLNVPCFSGVCQDVEMLNKNEFTTLTRFIGTFEMTGFAVCDILKHFRWKIVSVIAEVKVDIIWLLTRNGLRYAFERCDVTLASSNSLQPNMDVGTVLDQAASVSRIIILAMSGDTLREFMLAALQRGYTSGDFIFVAINYYRQPRVFGDYGWKQGDANDASLRVAYESLFFLSYYVRETSDEYLRFEEQVRQDSASVFGFNYSSGEQVPYPAANLYEATYLYAVAVNETLQEGGDITDGRSVARRLWNRTFSSITGSLSLNANGDREQAYMVRHLQDRNTGHVQLIGTYLSATKSLVIFPSKITWPGVRTEAPPDTPACGFDGALCRETAHARMMRIVYIFSITLAALIVFGSLGVALIYRRLKWQRELADMRWKASHEEIMSSHALGSGAFSTLSLRTTSSGPDADHMGQKFTRTVLYKGMVVAMRKIIHIQQVELSKAFLTEMKQLYDLSHGNVAHLAGACVEPGNVCLMTEYCTKGSLQDLLENDDINLDWPFKSSLLQDITQGLRYLHTSHIRYHGNLKSSNCVVDSRFVVKLTDFCPKDWMRKPQPEYKDLLWTAPECLPKDGFPVSYGNACADIYSLAVVMQEVVLREGPFYRQEETLEAFEIVARIRKHETPAFRPTVPRECVQPIRELITSCWEEAPESRPSLSHVQRVVLHHNGSGGRQMNIMDNLMTRMEQYATNLEGLVEERTHSYMEEKRRAEDLLHRLLPKSIADELQRRGHVAPQSYDHVTIYFSDIVQFTVLCSQSTPFQVVDMLNDLYTLFDEIISCYDVYKVETIGDAYMTVSGLPTPNFERHASEIASMALHLLSAVGSFKVRHLPESPLLLRIGLHTGPCVAGVVGLTMPRYCLFGDTVNTASRMESSGEALRVHISQFTADYLQRAGGFDVQERGEVQVKGKGSMKTFWLVSGPPDRENSLKLDNGTVTKVCPS